MATLAQVRTETYAILNDISTSSIYNSDYIDQCINDVQVEICDQQHFTFLRSRYLFDMPERTTLSSAITTGSTTLTVASTTNFASSGSVYVNHDIIAYTGKTSTTLTGCTGIDVGHAPGSYVFPLVAIPSTYNEMPALSVKRGDSLSNTTWRYVDEYDFFDSPITRKFTVIDDSNTLYLLIYQVQNTDVGVFKYIKKPTTLSADADNLTIPDPYALKIVPIFASARAELLRGDNLDGEALNKYNQASAELLKMKKHYGEREDGVRKVIQSAYGSRRTDFLSHRLRFVS